MKAELTGFADRLVVIFERKKEVKETFMHGVAIYRKGKGCRKSTFGKIRSLVLTCGDV